MRAYLRDTVLLAVMPAIVAGSSAVGVVRLARAQPKLIKAVVLGGHGAGLEAFAEMVNAEQ